MVATHSRVMGIRRVAALAGMLAAPFYLTLILVLGALEPGFSHRTSLMSLLGGVAGVRGLVFNLGVAATGILVGAFALGLKRELPSRWSTRVGSALLMLGALGLIGAGAFPCNQGCRNILVAPDLVGRVHTLAAAIAGLGTGLAPFFLAAAMRRDGMWRPLAKPTVVAATLANLPGIAFWIAFLTGHRLPSVEGILQRLGLVIVLLWMVFIAERWRRIDGRGE